MKTATEAANGYRCIECGHTCTELYHSYCDGVVKLIHCVKHFDCLFCNLTVVAVRN